MEPLQTVTEVVAELGGAQAVSGMFGCRTVNTVYGWTASNRFPAKTYLPIKKLLRAKGLDAADRLWVMAEVMAVEPTRPAA